MTSPVASPSPSPGIGADQSNKIWTVGTLRYDKQALFILFFWLMWNDFSITLLEQIGTLGGFLMKDHGATLTQMALLGTLGFFTPWLNPWVSTWSDRHRGKLGRRRPFLFFSTPFFAFFLGCYPYMPTIYHHVQDNPVVALVVRHLPVGMNGAVFFMGMSGLVSGIFNCVLLAIFSYLYWDVVPETLLGRFQAMSKIAVLLAGLLWNFFIFGQGEVHSKTVYVATASFCLVVYLISVWQIKEGEYPPPDTHKKGGSLAPIRAYFVECFSKSYYLWVFVASALYQMGNQGGGASGFYLRYDLNLSLAELGWAGGMSNLVITGLGTAFGFWVGVMTDKLKPVRLMGPIWVAHAAVILAMYFFVHGVWSLVILSSIRNVITFCLGVAFGAVQVEVFPREKLGQFCSAQAVFYQVIIAILGPFIGMLFDFLHNHYVNGYRLGFLWTAAFYGLSAICYFKVYLNWKKRHGHVPVPHAG